jgi:hypothetical protein
LKAFQVLLYLQQHRDRMVLKVELSHGAVHRARTKARWESPARC